MASNFWRGTHLACGDLTSATMIKNVQRIQNMNNPENEARRKKFWSMPMVKLEAVRYFSMWVALQSLCNESRAPVESAQKILHVCVRQNPTKEQAKVYLKDIAENLASNQNALGKQLNADQNADQKEIEN